VRAELQRCEVEAAVAHLTRLFYHIVSRLGEKWWPFVMVVSQRQLSVRSICFLAWLS
jgi:hypothetical protein